MLNVFTVFAHIDDYEHARLTITTHNGKVNLNATGSVLMMAADNMAHPFPDTNPASTLLTTEFKALTALS
jgi:hypothetical protein